MVRQNPSDAGHTPISARSMRRMRRPGSIMPVPVHLLHSATRQPTDVILVGAPERARLAAELLEDVDTLTDYRGLLGLRGRYHDRWLGVQTTGMGGGSNAIVLEELIMLGARRFVRVGSCGAFDPEYHLGDLVVAQGAIGADGIHRDLAGGGDCPLAPPPDGDLTAALQRTPGARTTLIASTDAFYAPPGDDAARRAAWRAAGASVVEMESATHFALAQRHGVRAATICFVSDIIGASTPLHATPAVATAAGQAALAGACEALAITT